MPVLAIAGWLKAKKLAKEGMPATMCVALDGSSRARGLVFIVRPCRGKGRRPSEGGRRGSKVAKANGPGYLFVLSNTSTHF